MSILVIAEQSGGVLRKSTLCAVSCARELATALGVDWHLAVPGHNVSGVASDLAGYGASTIRVADDASLSAYLAMPYAAATATIAKEVGAKWVLCSSSTIGKDLMPRVAVRLDAGLASDVVSVAGADGGVQLVRPLWAGNVMATVDILTDVKCLTVRTSDFDAAAESGGESAISSSESAVAAAQASGSKMRFVRLEATGGARPDLNEADSIISGGRGLKSEENFHILDELADSIGAAIGASRAAVDAGYAPNDYQIGQTGKSVAPNLYIAVAISGAIQHLAGMKNSKVIVAINKDPEAPIFQVSDYGLVADAFQAVPELAEAFRQVRAG
jgi:electron transfer flavoprotein alpha subunit